MLAAIVAININHAIGKDNKMLYRISKDLEHFRKVTMGNPIIMGRKTFESIGKPLPGRRNIILTRHNFDLPSDLPENTTVEICNDLTTLLNEAKWSDKTYFIIGGSDIYKQTINVVDKIYLTVIEDVNFDADAHFPLVPKEFKEIDRSEKHYDVKHKVHFTFHTLYRQQNYIDNILG